MPYRDRAQVEQWLSDFWDQHSLFAAPITIVDRDFTPDSDSGMVIAGLTCSPGVVYLSVHISDGRPQWRVTFEARHETLDLDAAGIAGLSGEMRALGILCEYLQARTEEAIARALA